MDIHSVCTYVVPQVHVIPFKAIFFVTVLPILLVHNVTDDWHWEVKKTRTEAVR